VTALYDRFQILADQPGLARSADRLKRGYLRYEWGSHVIFAKQSASGIRIVRVLHERMEPRLHI
jgi:toxin ParE1/3/4